MALTLTQLQDEMGVVLGTGARSGDLIRTSFTRWINMACRRIAYAYPWDSRRDDQTVVTVAPVTTGTVAVTADSTALTFTGVTLVSGMVGRKFSLGFGQPFYRIASVNVGAGTAVLAEAYREDTNASATYVIFQDEYDLSATTHSIEAIQLVKDRVLGPIIGYEQREMDDSDYVCSSSGRPTAWCVCTSTTVNTPRIRLTPCPDDVYRANVRFLVTFTALSAGGDLYTASLPEDVEELILDRALRWAPRVEGSRRVMSDQDFRKALALVWANHGKRRYRVGHRRGITSAGAPPAIVVSMAGIRT